MTSMSGCCSFRYSSRARYTLPLRIDNDPQRPARAYTNRDKISHSPSPSSAHRLSRRVSVDSGLVDMRHGHVLTFVFNDGRGRGTRGVDGRRVPLSLVCNDR